MTRLEILEEELYTIRKMDCLAFSIKEAAIKYYEHEIGCIKLFGSPNPDYDKK